MADLLDKLKRKKRLIRGPGGRLQLASQETVQQKAQQLGIAPPITALGTAGLGTTAQQRAMAGTPQQKQAAFQVAQDQTIQEAQRRRQFRTEMTAEEEQAKEKSQTLQNLGELGDRVQDLLNQALAQQGAEVSQQLQVNQQALEGAELQGGVSQDAFSQALQSLADPAADEQSKNQALVTINTALGKDPSAPVSMEELKQFFGDFDEQTAQSVAAAIPDQLLFTEDLATSLGFNNLQEVADTLGTTPDVLQEMSVREVDDLVRGLQAQQFNRVQEIKARLADPNVSAAEKEALFDELRELGSAGVRASEQQVQQLVEELGEAPEVEIGGQRMTIDQALNDEKISAMVVDYLTNPNSPVAEELPEDFKAFIDRNKDALMEAAADVKEDIKAFKEIQDFNQSIQQAGGAPLDDKVMEQLFGPDWKGFQTTKFDLEKVPAIQALMDEQVPVDQKANIVTALNTLQNVSPDLMKQVASLPKDKLDEMGVTTNSPQWRTYVQRAKAAPLINQAKTFQDFFKAYVGNIYDPNKAYTLVKDYAEMEKLGFAVPANQWQKVKAVFGDPNSFTSNSIQALKDRYNQELSSGGDITKYQNYQKPQLNRQDFNQLAQTADYQLYAKTKDYLKGGLSSIDIQRMKRALSFKEMQRLRSLRNIPKKDRIALYYGIRERVHSTANAMESALRGAIGLSPKMIQQFKSAADSADRRWRNVMKQQQRLERLVRDTGGQKSPYFQELEQLAARQSELLRRARAARNYYQNKFNQFKSNPQLKVLLNKWRSGQPADWNAQAYQYLTRRYRGII